MIYVSERATHVVIVIKRLCAAINISDSAIASCIIVIVIRHSARIDIIIIVCHGARIDIIIVISISNRSAQIIVIIVCDGSTLNIVIRIDRSVCIIICIYRCAIDNTIRRTISSA